MRIGASFDFFKHHPYTTYYFCRQILTTPSSWRERLRSECAKYKFFTALTITKR